MMTTLTLCALAATRPVLYAGLYPTVDEVQAPPPGQRLYPWEGFENEDVPASPPAPRAAAAAAAVAKPSSVLPAALTIATIIGATATVLAHSLLSSVRARPASTTGIPRNIPVALVIGAAAFAPAASCLHAEKSLDAQSVALYLTAMATAAAYLLWLVLRQLGAHRWQLGLLAHASLCVQPLVCGGLGWLLSSLDTIRTRRGGGLLRCFQCQNVFVPPPRAPIVMCPYCGVHNRAR